jgi:pimeloyl-ACP methyl ester carboxylesterase
MFFVNRKKTPPQPTPCHDCMDAEGRVTQEAVTEGGSFYVILLLSIFITACNPQSNKTDSATNSILKPCPGFAETGYAPLVDGAECGELEVDENPDDSKGKKISLNILRLPAISPVPEKDPLFLIQGGPGGSSVDMAAQIHYVFWDVRKNRDLIFVDQRGTGKSNPLTCDQLTEDQRKLSEAEQLVIQESLYKNCAEKYQSNAAFYTTPYAVKDLDQIRAALGYEKLNIWGGSYGTRVVLEYARQFPNRLRSMVLDGVAPVAISLPDYFARDAMAALTKLNDSCNQDTFCAKEYAPMDEKIDRLLKRLQQADADDKSVVIEYSHPRYQSQTSLTLTARQFSGLVFSVLYSRELSALLPQVIHQADQGNYQALANLNFLAEDNMKKMSITEGMRYSVICNEDYWLSFHRSSIPETQFLGYDFMKEMSNVCQLWSKSPLHEDYFKPVESNVPGLLLSGGFDPVTPAIWAEETLKYLPNSRSLLAKGGHHIVSYQGCLPQVIAQFIERASMEGINTSCVEKIQALSPNLGAYKSATIDEVQP